MAYAEKRISTARGSKGKVSWRARYKRPDGTWGSEPGFPTKKTADAWGEKQEAAIAAGRWVDPELMNTTFGVWARKWMKDQTPAGATVDTRWDRLEKQILPRWEHTPLIKITWYEVEAWSRTLTCAEVLVGHSITLMSQIMTGAADAQYIPTNPLYGRRRSTTGKNSSTGRRKETDEEMWAPPEVVLRLADRLGPANGLHVLTTAFTGLRWGEVTGLHRDNTLLTRRQAHDGGFFECPIIRVHPDVGELAEYEERDDDGKKLGTVLRIEPPKNRPSVRDIDLPPFLARLLRYHLDDWPHPYVFSTLSGTFWRRGNWGKTLRPAADGRPERKRRQGVSARPAWEPIMPGLSSRDLRHSHDTYQDQIGVKAALMHEQAGHKRPGIKGTYQHPTPAMRQERLDGLQEIYERAMENLGWETLWGRVDLVKHPRTDDLPNISQMISRGGGRSARGALRRRSGVVPQAGFEPATPALGEPS